MKCNFGTKTTLVQVYKMFNIMKNYEMTGIKGFPYIIAYQGLGCQFVLQSGNSFYVVSFLFSNHQTNEFI